MMVTTQYNRTYFPISYRCVKGFRNLDAGICICI